MPRERKFKGKCWKCNKEGHMASDCPYVSEGTQCGICHMYGHETKDCFEDPKNWRKRPRNWKSKLGRLNNDQDSKDDEAHGINIDVIV